MRVLARRVGARVVASPTWLREVVASHALAALRKDRRETMLRVVEVLAREARADSTSAPTWPVIIKDAKVSRATLHRCLTWLHSVGLLVTVEHGSTQRFRGRGGRGGKGWGRGRRWGRRRGPEAVIKGNRAAVYLLIVPVLQVVEPVQAPAASGSACRGSEHETPLPTSRSEVGRNCPPRARARPPGPVGLGTTGKNRLWTGKEGGYQRHDQRGSRGQQRRSDLEIAAALRGRALDLRRASVAAIRSVIRPFTAAGWSVEDLAYAIDHEVGGAARIFTSGPMTTTPIGARHADAACPDAEQRRQRERAREDVRGPIAHPAGWLRSRLDVWAPRAAGGRVGPVTEHRQASRRASLAIQAANAAARAEHAADRAATSAPTAGFAAARAALAARPRRSSRLGNWMPDRG